MPRSDSTRYRHSCSRFWRFRAGNCSRQSAMQRHSRSTSHSGWSSLPVYRGWPAAARLRCRPDLLVPFRSPSGRPEPYRSAGAAQHLLGMDTADPHCHRAAQVRRRSSSASTSICAGFCRHFLTPTPPVSTSRWCARNQPATVGALLAWIVWTRGSNPPDLGFVLLPPPQGRSMAGTPFPTETVLGGDFSTVADGLNRRPGTCSTSPRA